MKRLFTTLVLLFAGFGLALAQRTVTGTVTGDGDALIGASVAVKGASGGARTDINGRYSVQVPAGATALVFSYTGYTTQEVTLNASNVVDVVMNPNTQLEEVLVTAFGITRYKNELAYSAQKVDGQDLTNTRDANISNALSGRVAGLEIKRTTTLGGSTNVVLRGAKSLTGDNQALFVVDGVPIDNSNTNTADQKRGRGGFDYGNAANDINSDDVASVSVLKGAAATALYGSRASNGVVLITTKKGSKDKGFGVTVNAGMNFGQFDKSTFVKYQKKYGAGYGRFYQDVIGEDSNGDPIYYEDQPESDYYDNFFLNIDVDGNGTLDKVVPTTEDASWGAKFDPNLLVYQWDAFDPSSPNFGKKTPWVAGANDPTSMFETALGTNNGILIDGSNEKGYFKLGYNRATDKGIMPNSRINKDLFNFGASYNLSSKLEVFTAGNFTSTDGLGRYGSGYESRNLMTNFRQWWQVNVDVQDQRRAYDATGQNVTWNWADAVGGGLVPIYWDNPYWTRNENYSNDHRNRYFGNAGANFKITNWLTLTGRVSLDKYDEVQEERFAVGSIDVSQYSRFNRNFNERNVDFLAQIPQRNLTDKIKFDALIGSNFRETSIASIRATTNGGLNIPGLYSLSNTVNALEAPDERFTELKVNGVFAQTGLVYDRWAVLDLSLRRDQASSLPSANNSYFYPAASLGIIFSEFLNTDAISFGKIRLNYAQVGNTAPPLSVLDAYNVNTGFGNTALTALPTTKNNPDLKPERTESMEGGLEMRFMKDKFGFDFTYYKTNTFDQILPADISRATGYAAKFINAGEIENKGIELSLFIRPVNTKNFSWRIEANWARNRNKVIDLGGIDNLLLGSFQGGVSINATKGEPYGTIRGSNFLFHENGGKIVGTNGRYRISPASNQVIGNVNADWTGAVINNIRYKNFTLGFLIDIKKGGDVFSLDQYYGLATGAYEETAGLNDLGNEVRAPLDQGGGLIVEGVKDDGTPNDLRISAEDFGLYGYRRNPAAAFVYDASFIKLREVTLDFAFPTDWMRNGGTFKSASLGVYGRNLWIIHKNLPNADPEDGISSGNVQGYQGGSYPSVRTMGVNLKLKF